MARTYMIPEHTQQGVYMYFNVDCVFKINLISKLPNEISSKEICL